ncbi:Uncharacterized protein FKW44_001114 [Caligus rogercresseyi]|uniref:Helicase C-terminal domain-containing protein n=1 Tax=Caligus rogercresseyi TaxID=217165 RepID=A0A7T8KIC1_CALRO|nr:Uncharacterized protein FKW44_001114 [Caligus rogercresseyi]
MLDILGDYLKLKGHKYACLDGRMNFTERQQNIKDFSASPDIKIFLLSTRAGGLGINLTAADTVIIYDSDWNPQSDLQAQDRCHRIGQTKPVNVYRLVTSNTIDERIVQRATSKRRLEKMVIHEKKFKCDEDSREMNCLSLTPKDLKELLEHSDHSRVVDRKDGAIFTPKELAALMDRGSSTDSKYNSFKTLKLSQNDTQLKTVEAKEN